MNIKSILGTLCTCLTMLSINANAALIDITATSIDSRFTDFTLRFDDISGDGLLQIDEVVLFSGFTLTNPTNPSGDGVFNIITGTADITGISTLSGIPLFSSANWNFKRSHNDTALCCSSDFWTYSSADVIASPGNVIANPIPAAVWLFGSGFICLIGFARKQHRKDN